MHESDNINVMDPRREKKEERTFNLSPNNLIGFHTICAIELMLEFKFSLEFLFILNDITFAYFCKFTFNYF